ncbi:MAG: ATP-binding protein [Phycisphaerales bacterium]
MPSRLSLANKCQLLFGAAVVAILAGALAVPWVRTDTLVEESQREVARQLAQTWLGNGIALGQSSAAPIPMRLVRVDARVDDPGASDEFVRDAIQRFSADPSEQELFVAVSNGSSSQYRYARAIRETQWRAIEDRRVMDFLPHTVDASLDDPLRAVLVIERTSEFAAGQLMLSRVTIVATGLVAGLLAVLVFYFILTKLVLSPMHKLRETAERVQRGDLAVRSKIATGDDFEQLGDAINTMLDRVQLTQEQLRTMNESLDLKVSQLAEANLGLDESNRLKSEFVANVSHELRTPLNSIIGFAELLEELARGEAGADPKRLRYIGNILVSGRSLLDMINDLLQMAKLEAGRMEVSVEPVSVADVIEGLQTIMRPQAEEKSLTLSTRVGADVPVVETDPGKLQQILYNFLSNAIKFSPSGATITIAADRVARDDAGTGVRISVIDRGPGIPYDQQETIFRRFRQLEASHTRKHGGTGLGLAICRELGDLLGATVSVVSQPGKGAAFAVELPVVYKPKEMQPLMG